MSMEFELEDGKPTFFGFGKVSDEAVQQCIDVFNLMNPYQGIMGTGIDKKKKDSLDLGFLANNTMLIQKEMTDFLQDYQKYFHLNDLMPDLDMLEPFNVQKYPYGGAYHGFHHERVYGNDNTRFRELVWMVYLNDVQAGGETEWVFQQKKIKPEKGLAVIWPVDWNFVHRGLPSHTTEKMIATGWFSTHPY